MRPHTHRALRPDKSPKAVLTVLLIMPDPFFVCGGLKPLPAGGRGPIQHYIWSQYYISGIPLLSGVMPKMLRAVGNFLTKAALVLMGGAQSGLFYAAVFKGMLHVRVFGLTSLLVRPVEERFELRAVFVSP